MKKIYIFILIILLVVIVITPRLIFKSDTLTYDSVSDTLDNYYIDLSNIDSSYDYNNSILTIKKSGNYYLTNELDGSIVINSSGIVYLTLDNVTINSLTSYAINVTNASKVVINILDETVNTLSSTLINDEVNATIYSNSNLIITGCGNLNITASDNGIYSKGYIQILSGNMNINSNNEGIKAKDYLAIKSGNININSNSNGIKITSSDGYILIDDANITINSNNDAIESYDITIENGVFNLTTKSSSESSKAIKASNLVTINGGEFYINSTDDSIHSNSSVIINGGTYTISSGDDGIHADNYLEINNGNINIKNSSEGLEASKITINEGTIYVNSTDDGININSSSSDSILTINGGYINVSSDGDGLDSNNSILMTNGIVIVNGPVSNSDGAIDYDGTFKITGGTLIASGSSGMLQGVSTSSTQYSLTINFGSKKEANSTVSIMDGDGEVLTFAPSKTYSSIVISTPSLNIGTYYIYVDGKSTSSSLDGVYELGGYSGTLYKTVDINSYVTTVGNINMPAMGGIKRR